MSKFNGLLTLYCLTAAIVTPTSLPATSLNSYCEIHDHNLDFVYNLTQLSNNEEDITIEYDRPDGTVEIIRMQLCSPLKKKCNNQDGYAICLLKNKTEIGIGKFPPQVVNDRKILFNFTGDKCVDETNYTMHIIMKCDYEAVSNSKPELFPHVYTQCNLFILWTTALACGHRTVTDCTVVNDGRHYDLSPLTRYSSNYGFLMERNLSPWSPVIIVNVCHSIIRENYDSICPIKAGACLGYLRDHSYSSIGEVEKPPFFVNGRLKLEYQNGALCNVPNITTTHMQTTISFICNPEATNTIPEYIGGKENCHYQLIWYTAAACSIEFLRSYSVNTAGKCTVTNPVTNFTYNLQSLMNRDYTVTSASDIKYKFRVCGSLTDNVHNVSAGVWDSKHDISLGQANTNLMWQQGGPYLNYTNGNICENFMHHYTIIGFFCGPEGSANTPLLMEEYPCQTVIHWNTDLVCEKRIKCTTDDDDEINLTLLIRSTNNYVVKANGTEFHINICRPLVPTQGLTCAHGSAACKVSVTPKGEYTKEISLGFPENSPTLNKDLQTVLRYIGGSQCPENPAKSISANFTFICDNNNQELPVFKQYVDCTYMFEWNTSIACGAVIGAWASPCTIKDNFLSQEYDLSLLYKNQQIHYVKGKQGKDYGISICGGEKYCNGSAICHGTNGYGSLWSVIFDYSRDDVKLKYSNGSKCNNSSYTSEVRFICNQSIAIGAPKLLLESQYGAEFEWHTEVICAKHANQHTTSIPRASEQKEQSYPKIISVGLSSSYTRTVVVVGVILTVIVVLAVILYFRDPEKRTCFRSCMNLFSFRRGADRVQYCRVDTTEEARLLLDASDPTQCQTDSDDDLLRA